MLTQLLLIIWKIWRILRFSKKLSSSKISREIDSFSPSLWLLSIQILFTPVERKFSFNDLLELSKCNVEKSDWSNFFNSLLNCYYTTSSTPSPSFTYNQSFNVWGGGLHTLVSLSRFTLIERKLFLFGSCLWASLY